MLILALLRGWLGLRLGSFVQHMKRTPTSKGGSTLTPTRRAPTIAQSRRFLAHVPNITNNGARAKNTYSTRRVSPPGSGQSSFGFSFRSGSNYSLLLPLAIPTICARAWRSKSPKVILESAITTPAGCGAFGYQGCQLNSCQFAFSVATHW